MNRKSTKSLQHYRPSRSKRRKFKGNRFTSSIETLKSYPTSFGTMSHEQLSLCWDNFHLNMSSGINSLLVNEDLVDVTLAIDGQYLKAHKMILSVCSPYFKTLFSVNPCKHPIVFMKDISYSVMNDLLTFMYQGEVQVNQENLDMLIKTAEALEIKGLAGDNKNIEDVIGVKSKRPIQQCKTKTIRKQSIPSPMKKTKLSLPSVETETIVPAPIDPKTLIKPEIVSTANLIKNCARTEAYDSTLKYQINDFDQNQVDGGLVVTENYDIEKAKEDKEVFLPPSIDSTVEIKPEFVSTTGINNCMNLKMESCDSSLEGDVNDNSFEGGAITEFIDEALDGSFMDGIEQTKAGTSDNQGCLVLSSEYNGQDCCTKIPLIRAPKCETIVKKGSNRRSYGDTSLRLQALHWAHFPQHIAPTARRNKPTRTCKVCTRNKKRSETTWECKQCKVALHVPNCFEKYHTIQNY